MPTLTVRIDDETRDEVEALARARGLTVSELLRVAVDNLLGRDVDRPREDVPASLTMFERRLLEMQHEIMARLTDDRDEIDVRAQHARALAEGFSGEYSNEFAGIHPELSRRDCALVWDILDMFQILKVSVAHLGPDELASLGEHAESALTFRGFDVNDAYESRLRSYAEFLIATDRWQELAVHFDAEHERGNSHAPYLATYRRMLDAFQPLWKARLERGLGRDALRLPKNELATVYAAWPYSAAGGR